MSIEVGTLQKFCYTGETRPYLTKPYSRGDRTIATDGYVCVSVPRIDTFPEDKRAPDAEATVLSKYRSTEPASFSSDLLPPPIMRDCADCGGNGKSHSCGDCSHACEDCGGSGKTEENTSTSIDGALVSVRHLRRCIGLPGFKLFKGVPNGAHSVFYFTFDGGEGCIAGLNAQYTNHVELKSAA